jgi:sugar phosphate isomerase/epimerase
VNRREFLSFAALGSVSQVRAQHASIPFQGLGINTYCVRSLNLHDAALLEYAASLHCDAIFLQDSRDPNAQNPAHWREVRELAKRHGLHLETGGGGVLPRSAEDFQPKVEYVRTQIRRAAAMGSPIMRAVIASDRFSMPDGPVEQHIETMVKLLRTVRNEAIDAGVKIAVEVHKDLNAWEYAVLVEEAGKDFVGIYLDTGNPVFVMEHPMTTVEILGKYALTFHLRDSVVYEHPKGIAVQWVPLGEGTVNFREIIAKAKELCPQVYVYSKPIGGRPPVVLPVWDEAYWKRWFPRARASDFARFVELAKQGAPFDKPMVVEDLAGRQVPPQFQEAIRYQQKEHVERSLRYAKETLGLGRRWRTAAKA